MLLQILFHAQIANETGKYDIYDVVDTIGKKLIRRHPHVFGNRKINSIPELIKVWNEIKKQEKVLPMSSIQSPTSKVQGPK